MPSPQKVAIDVGSGFVKFTTGPDVKRFDSVAIPAAKIEGKFGAVAHAVVRWKGEHGHEAWLTGEEAKVFNSDSHTDCAPTLTTLWAGSPGWWALLYRAIAVSGLQGEIALATGLPMKQWEDKKDELTTALRGIHEFTVGTQAYHINIVDASVLPQAAGLQLYQNSAVKKSMKRRSGYIDIGTFTTGFCVIEILNDGTLAYLRERCHGVNVGTGMVAFKLATSLHHRYSCTVPLYELHQAMGNGYVLINNQKTDLRRELSRLATMVYSDLRDALIHYWGSDKDMDIYVGGGGAKHFLEAIQGDFPGATEAAGGMDAVVRGLFLMLVAQEAQKARESSAA